MFLKRCAKTVGKGIVGFNFIIRTIVLAGAFVR